jgi:hypothetical protein
MPPDIFKSPAMTASSPIVSNNPVQKKKKNTKKFSATNWTGFEKKTNVF